MASPQSRQKSARAVRRGAQPSDRAVLLPMPARPAPTDYAVPAGMAAPPATSSQVPLGPRQVLGVVWDGEALGDIDPTQARGRSTARSTAPPLAADDARFVDWVAGYTLDPARHGGAHAAARAGALRAGSRAIGVGSRDAASSPTRMTAGAAAGAGRLRADGLAWPRAGLAACRRRLARRRRRRSSAQGVLCGRVGCRRDAAVAAARPAATAPRLCADQAGGRRDAARAPSRRAAFASRCSTASPARARPRSISRRSPQALPARPAGADPAAGDRAHPARSSTASRAASAPGRREWHSDVAAAAARRVWRAVADGRRAGWWSARARRCSCRSPSSG